MIQEVSNKEVFTYLKFLTGFCIIVLLIRCSTIFLIDISSVLVNWSLGFCMLAILISFCFRYRKRRLTKRPIVYLIIGSVITLICFLPIDRYLRMTRLYIWKQAYESSTAQIIEQAQDTPIQLHFPERCLVGFRGEISYQKSEEGSIICFPIHIGFFKRCDFVYVSYQDMESFQEHPSKLAALLLEQGVATYTRFIDENWAYVEYR